ncbi:MAG: 5'-3' exonuclease H3TH domain-containing protein, partial [Burkholderiales bacterium]
MPNSLHASRKEISHTELASFGSFSFFIVSGNHPEKTLLLVDGSSYLYRAFHALPELKSPQGEPTGAIYGVLSMLRRLGADYKAQARICVFDAKGKTFRDDAYREYKANRPPMPDDLAAQIEPLKEAVEALGWPAITIEGVEADDVIATLSEQAKALGWRCIISTGDKDLAQLVDPAVTLVNTMSNETLDVAGVQRKFGVAPERIVDYFALVGDAVDNVPGVAKVGPKTAAKWISQFGSLDQVIAHASDIGGVAGENLRETLDWLPQARMLLSVKRDVPLPITLAELEDGVADLGRQRALFERFGFHSWRNEIGGDAPAAARAPAAERTERAERRRYLCALDEQGLRELLAALQDSELVGFDTETTGLEPMVAQLVGMSFACGPIAAYLPLAHEYPGAPAQLGVEPALALLRPWLEDAARAKVGQNLK